MLNAAELLFGVKTTLNRLAEKLESSWQVLSDVETSFLPSLPAEAVKSIEAIEASTNSGALRIDRILTKRRRKKSSQ